MTMSSGDNDARDAWVTADKLDPERITLSASNSTEGYERYKIMYKYSEGSEPRDLTITVPRVTDAYLRCRGVQKDFFTRGDTRIQTNRYGAHFILNAGNSYHSSLYDAFAIIKSKVELLTESETYFPIRDMQGYSVLYTSLIHSNDGKMYSSAYTANEQIDITGCRASITRPAFTMSILRKSSKEVKIRLQLSQMYVHENINEFPLAHME